LDDDDKVLNIARFLQTIDEDDFPPNGITVSAETRSAAIGKSIDFDQPSHIWEDDAAVLATIAALTPHSLVDETTARNHILAWIAASRAGEYGGSYSSTPSGFNGGWRLSVSTTGEVILIANLEDADFGGSGTLDGADGSFSVTTYFEGEICARFQGSIIGTDISGSFVGLGYYDGVTGTMSGDLIIQPMTFLDLDLLENFEDLDGEIISGEAQDDEGYLSAYFLMHLSGDEFGRYEVRMDVDTDFNGTYLDIASFYVTSMTSTRISFRGLCTSGEGFSGSLNPAGVVSGTYYTLYAGDAGGTFSGHL
jgi:hypothetical protein